MTESQLLDRIERTADGLLEDLRMARGLNSRAMDSLLKDLKACGAIWRNQDRISKRSAALLFDFYPAMVSSSYAYPPKEQSVIQQAAEQLAECVRECLN